MTEKNGDTPVHAFGIVPVHGSLHSSPKPVLMFADDGRLSIADVDSSVWDELIGDDSRWYKEAHQVEYILEKCESVESAVDEIKSHDGFNHVLHLSWTEAKNRGKYAERAKEIAKLMNDE